MRLEGWRVWAAVGLGLTGCGPSVAVMAAEDSSRSPADGSGDGAGTATIGPGGGDGSSGMPSTSADPTGATGTSSTSDAPGTFIPDPDQGGDPFECDLWTDDCPRGETCMPWSHHGGGGWNGTRCSPLAPDAGQPGEPCTLEGSANSGIDDCAARSMCWDVDPATNAGTCVAMCGGIAVNPTCENACDRCFFGGAVLLLCLPECDPLVPEGCGGDEVCVPSSAGFLCAPQGAEDDSGIGAPCAYLNSCDAGLFCAGAVAVPGCRGSACCAPYCNPGLEDTCDALLPGTTCVPWFKEGEWPGEGCTSAAPGMCMAT